MSDREGGRSIFRHWLKVVKSLAYPKDEAWGYGRTDKARAVYTAVLPSELPQMIRGGLPRGAGPGVRWMKNTFGLTSFGVYCSDNAQDACLHLQLKRCGCNRQQHRPRSTAVVPDMTSYRQRQSFAASRTSTACCGDGKARQGCPTVLLHANTPLHDTLIHYWPASVDNVARHLVDEVGSTRMSSTYGRREPHHQI